MSVACVIIASAHRQELLDTHVVPSALAAGFDEVVVVGDYHGGAGYCYLPVPPLTHSTIDALVKRDVGTLATTSDWLFYLCDDHAIARRGTVSQHEDTIIVPNRLCLEGALEHRLNAGLDARDPNAPYCGGHAGLFSRTLIQRRPWTTMPHDRLWDLISSRIYQNMGALLSTGDWWIEDLTPETQPWR